MGVQFPGLLTTAGTFAVDEMLHILNDGRITVSPEATGRNTNGNRVMDPHWRNPDGGDRNA